MEKVPPYTLEDGQPPRYKVSDPRARGRAKAYVQQPLPSDKKLAGTVRCYRCTVGLLVMFLVLTLVALPVLIWFSFFRVIDDVVYTDATMRPERMCQNGGTPVYAPTSGKDLCMCPVFAKGESCETLLSDCTDVKAAGEMYDGVYTVLVGSREVHVYCDMRTEGHAWTVLMRRVDGSEDFARSWQDYKHGFGSLDRDFWIGNDIMHELTENDLGYTYELRVDIEMYNGTRAYAEYKHFTVAGEENKYQLSVDHYSGDAGDSLERHDGSYFSTIDRDNDAKDGGECARNSGGWWYADCFNVKLTGRFGQALNWQGIIWRSLAGNINLKSVDMKVRAARPSG